MKQAGLAVFGALALIVALPALADRVSTTYAPDGGAVLPRLSARRGLYITNANTVAVCCAPQSTPPPGGASCQPILPGAGLSLDAADSVSWSCRLCSGATMASCLPDGGILTLETQ